jgi:hypothetical protein
MCNSAAEYCRCALEHECAAHADFIQSLPVSVRMGCMGSLKWTVFVFALEEYRFADRAYCWQDDALLGEEQFFAVMHVPPITGPHVAVRLVLETYRSGHPDASKLRQGFFARLLDARRSPKKLLTPARSSRPNDNQSILPFHRAASGRGSPSPFTHH